MDKFRILVVDDERDVRTVLRLALSTKYEVVEAHDGLDALEKLERAEPDLVVLDIMMPLMDGYATCRSIRKNPRFREIPVLFLSAKTDKEAIKEGYGAGANLYITKPFEPERVVRNIEYFFKEQNAKPRPKKLAIEQVDQPTIPKPRSQASAPPAAEPKEAPQPETPPPPKRPESARPPRPRVIIVDDDCELLDLLTVALSDDFEVTTAMDGIEAVEKIIVYQPDLVVLDAMMPKMSGYQICASLRRNRNFSDVPIIFISAKSSERDQEYCRRLGADEFIAKPFDPHLLRQRLLAYTKKPDFFLRPKKLTIEQIRMRERAEKEWLEERERRARSRRRTAEIRNLIDRET